MQAPNLLLWIVIATGALSMIAFDPGPFRVASTTVFHAALLAWAADEIFRGVNPWRRLLGTAIVIYQLVVWLG